MAAKRKVAKRKLVVRKRTSATKRKSAPTRRKSAVTKRKPAATKRKTAATERSATTRRKTGTKTKTAASKSARGEEIVLAVFVPALVAQLKAAEDEQGSPLTQTEVEAIRDGGMVIGMTPEMAEAAADARGYEDIDPERVWAEWSEVRLQLHS